MSGTDEIVTLIGTLTDAHDKVRDLQTKLQAIADQASDEYGTTTGELDAARTDFNSIQLTLQQLKLQESTVADAPLETQAHATGQGAPTTDVRTDDRHVFVLEGRDSPMLKPVITADSSTRHSTSRVSCTMPKTFTYGGNFRIWTTRMRRFMSYATINNSIALDMLLNNVDDKTEEYLDPFVKRMTKFEHDDPDLFIQILEDAFYPKGEVRGLRQEIMSGDLKQKTDETVDDFASRIRSLGRRAYADSDYREEPCLNAFLCGLRDTDLYNMVISARGSSDDFETAVMEARKFEKLRRKRPTDDRLADDATHLVYRTYGRQSPTEHSSPEPHALRNATLQSPSSHENDSRIQGSRDSGNNRHRNTNSGPGGRRPRRPLTEVQCYRCDLYGHYAVNCPLRQTLNRNGAGSSGPGNL